MIAVQPGACLLHPIGIPGKDGLSQCILQLLGIRLEHGGRSVSEESSTLRIHDRGYSFPLRTVEDFFDDLGNQHALVVVLQHNRGTGGESPTGFLSKQPNGVGTHVVRVLPVDAHDLLVPRQDPRLYRRRSLPDLHQACDAHAESSEALAELVSCIITTHAPDQVTFGTERNHVGRDIGGAAHAHPLLVHLNDGYRRFRRDPRYGARNVSIEHEVPDDEHPCLLRALQDALDTAGRQ